jgi:hypothetical protein
VQNWRFEAGAFFDPVRAVVGELVRDKARASSPDDFTSCARYDQSMKELIVPPGAAAENNAVEMARVWHANGKQHVSLNAPGWKDPAAWGLLLVDVARHVADAYAKAEGRDSNEVLRRIRAGLDAEWESPTDKPKGSF